MDSIRNLLSNMGIFNSTSATTSTDDNGPSKNNNDANSENEQHNNMPGSFEPSLPREPHNPTPQDVHVARSLLRRFLPTELVLQILTHASYHPTIIASNDTPLILSAIPPGPPRDTPLTRGRFRVPQRHQHRPNHGARLYILTSAIPYENKAEDENLRVKRVKISIRSHDQGWGGEPGTQGTYTGSWTWFEASILRPTSPPAQHGAGEASSSHDHAQGQQQQQQRLEADDAIFEEVMDRRGSPEDFLDDMRTRFALQPVKRSENEDGIVWLVQRNLCANSAEREHNIVWPVSASDDPDATAEELEERGAGDGRGFVESLKGGDRVALWARAMFPGWENHVASAKVEIEYDV